MVYSCLSFFWVEYTRDFHGYVVVSFPLHISQKEVANWLVIGVDPFFPKSI